MLFTNSPKPPWRLTPFAGSAAAHCILITILTFLSASERHNGEVEERKPIYQVRFIHLQMPDENSRVNSSPASGLAAPRVRATASLVAPGPTAAPGHREFKLPDRAHVPPVRQTLVQTDVPPDIVLKHEVSLPTVMLWTQTELAPPPKKQFIAPPAKALSKRTVQLPSAPVLDSPNREVKVADLNIAALVEPVAPHLVRPPAKASPVAAIGQDQPPEIPQIGSASSSEPIPANVISLPDNPTRPTSVLVLPPANQIASSGAPGGGPSAAESTPGGGGKGSAGDTAGRSKVAGAGADGGATEAKDGGAGAGGSGDRPSHAAGAGSSASGGASGTGSRPESSGTGDGLAAAIPGTTRLTPPKDGKFGVVVAGSAGSASYPESVGALSGKVVYTVYLKVGLRKSWIFQYCVPGAAEALNGQKGSTPPLTAPWPFLILRPDGWSSSDPDYIMIHGMLTSAGEFNQLAMVFPEEFERKDLILKSLNSWAFRPATRDGEPVAVEVLLIIPNESQ